MKSAVSPPGNHEASDPFVGRIIHDRYRLIGLIAKGGMGRVYRGEHVTLGRPCAVKVLYPSHANQDDPEFERRFFLEASIASRLRHPNTVSIFDYGCAEDGTYYMVMEYLEGVTLQRAVKEAGRMPEGRVAHIAAQICRSLREAHTAGVMHRDLKPANVFLVRHQDEADVVKVLDFGLVKSLGDDAFELELTQEGLFMGSPKYMAPEQAQGERVDERADIYSLGVMLYEMLTGKVPFDRPGTVHTLMAHLHDPPPPLRVMAPHLELSSGMEALVMRCLAKRSEARPRSMHEILTTLKGLASETSGSRDVDALLRESARFELSSLAPTAHTIRPPPMDSVAPAAASSASVLAAEPSGSVAALAPASSANALAASSAELYVERAHVGRWAWALTGGAVGLVGTLVLLLVAQQVGQWVIESQGALGHEPATHASAARRDLAWSALLRVTPTEARAIPVPIGAQGMAPPRSISLVTPAVTVADDLAVQAADETPADAVDATDATP